MAAIETKTFNDGNDVVLLLPDELGFTADMAVTIERIGKELWIRPAQVKDSADMPDRPGLC